MALQSHSNTSDELASVSPDCSSETTPTEVYSSPLGINGGISGLYLSNEELNPINLLGDAVADRAPRNIVLNSEGTRIGDDVYVTVQGPANFTVNHVGPGCQPLENGAQKDGTTPTILKVKRLRKALYVLPFILLISLTSLAFISPTTTTTDENIPKFVNRTLWGAKAPKSQTKTHDPYQVIVKHTGGSFCTTFHHCSHVIQAIQKVDMEEDNMTDIRYNFLIGGDGRIYEGRGWENENADCKNTIDMAFVGDFNERKPTAGMLDVARELIAQGCAFLYLNYDQLSVLPASSTEEVGKHLVSETSLYEEF